MSQRQLRLEEQHLCIDIRRYYCFASKCVNMPGQLLDRRVHARLRCDRPFEPSVRSNLSPAPRHPAQTESRASHHSRDHNLHGPLCHRYTRSNPMTSYELDRALRQLRMSGMADRSVTDTTSPSGEPRDDFSDWKFNTVDRALILDRANSRFIEQHEDVLLLGNARVGKATSLKRSAWLRSTPVFAYCVAKPTCSSKICFSLAQPASAALRSRRSARYHCSSSTTSGCVSSLLTPPGICSRSLCGAMTSVDDSHIAIDDWPKLFCDTPAVAAFLDRLTHHLH